REHDGLRAAFARPQAGLDGAGQREDVPLGGLVVDSQVLARQAVRTLDALGSGEAGPVEAGAVRLCGDARPEPGRVALEELARVPTYALGGLGRVLGLVVRNDATEVRDVAHRVPGRPILAAQQVAHVAVGVDRLDAHAHQRGAPPF